jgi:hypothetical protein
MKKLIKMLRNVKKLKMLVLKSTDDNDQAVIV